MSDLDNAIMTLADQLKEDLHRWLDEELDRIYDRLVEYDLGDDEMDLVEFFVNTIHSRPFFYTEVELHAFLVGVCMGTSILFGFEDEAVELLSGLADRFAEEFELPSITEMIEAHLESC